MKIAKRAIIFYFVGLIALTFHTLILGTRVTSLSDQLLMDAVPAVVLLLGLLLGWFGHMIIQHVRWIRSFYLFGLNLSFILFIGVLGAVHFHNWQKCQRYGYDPDGIAQLERAEENGDSDIVDGFEQLQRSFPQPRQLHFTGYLYTCRPSDIPNDTIKTIYYIYYVGEDSAAKRISKMERKDKKFMLLAFNRLPASDTVYLNMKADYLDWRRKKMDTIISILKAAKNSK